MTNISRELVERSVRQYHFGHLPDSDLGEMCLALRDALDKAEADKKELALQVIASDGQAQDAYEAQVKAEAERDALRAENEGLRESLERIDEASNHYAMTSTYSEGTLRYAHQSTRNLARAALQENNQ
jgi:hypothetical protein